LRFIHSNDSYHDIGGNKDHKTVPLEEGTSPGHWNEWLFPDDSWGEGLTGSWSPGDELMTTQPSLGKFPFLSPLTIGAFKDLGFEINQDYKPDMISVYSGEGGTFISNPLFNRTY